MCHSERDALVRLKSDLLRQHHVVGDEVALGERSTTCKRGAPYGLVNGCDRPQAENLIN
jgi:hypothetical protein